MYNGPLVPRHKLGPFPFITLFVSDDLINTVVQFTTSSGTRDAHPLRRGAVTPNERTREANATASRRRPSQRRLTQEQLTLPARLVHLRHLPWLDCYRRQLQTENKSENTQKSYFYGLRPLIETVLPTEDVLDEAAYEALSIEALAERMEPMNGRLDVWAHSIAGLKPTTYNARIAAARHFIRWLGLIWPDHLQRARTGKRLPRTLTRRELTTVLEMAELSEDPAASLVVTMMLDTGMRVSEVCELNLEDIDFDDGSARVLGGKGDKDRLVLFTKRTLERLQAWMPIRNRLVVLQSKHVSSTGTGGGFSHVASNA